MKTVEDLPELERTVLREFRKRIREFLDKARCSSARGMALFLRFYCRDFDPATRDKILLALEGVGRERGQHILLPVGNELGREAKCTDNGVIVR